MNQIHYKYHSETGLLFQEPFLVLPVLQAILINIKLYDLSSKKAAKPNINNTRLCSRHRKSAETPYHGFPDMEGVASISFKNNFAFSGADSFFVTTWSFAPNLTALTSDKAFMVSGLPVTGRLGQK